MPELPEVEVTRLGLHSHIVDKKITGITIRQSKLRWPVPEDMQYLLKDKLITNTQRRGKYLLFEISGKSKQSIGWLMIHLGMSGTLRLIDTDEPASVHDHIDLHLGRASIRFRDPRRFGAVLWHPITHGPIAQHRLLVRLGVEPLTEDFIGIAGARYLYQHTRTRQQSIKQVLLAGHIVVGVGNIYANEALFHAGIHPKTPSNKIGLKRYLRLVNAIRQTLQMAIDKGGSSLRDFVASDGRQGYFQFDYMVYAQTHKPCRICNAPIQCYVVGQRSTFFCPRCQRG